jgi:hypothetical protein
MKKIFAGILILVAVSSAFAAARFDAKTWHKVQSYDVKTLSKNLADHTGQLVEIHFQFRGKDIHHMKPNWYEGSIWQTGGEGKKGFANVRVMVAKKDLPAFKSLPISAGADMTVYGKVLRDSDANFMFVRLIGRNTIVDPAGNVTVSW